MKTAGQLLLEDMRAVGLAESAPAPLQELDLSAIWRGVGKAAGAAVKSLSGAPKSKPEPKSEPKPVAKPKKEPPTPAAAAAPAPAAASAPAPVARQVHTQTPKAATPTDQSSPSRPAVPPVGGMDKKPTTAKKAKCVPIKDRPGRYKCTSPQGTVYYKDAADLKKGQPT